MHLIFILLALVVLAVIAILILAQLTPGPTDEQYKRRKLMTDNELEFFGRLVMALPDHFIFPQVSMSALLEPSSKDNKRAHSDRLRIAQQRVDYLVCNRDCDIIAVVELDDKTHSGHKDAIRDQRLQQGGIRTIRFQSRSKPTPDGIRSSVLPPTVVPGTAISSKADMQPRDRTNAAR